MPSLGILLTTALVAPALGRTVHSVVVFSRHGDSPFSSFPETPPVETDKRQEHQKSSRATK